MRQDHPKYQEPLLESKAGQDQGDRNGRVVHAQALTSQSGSQKSAAKQSHRAKHDRRRCAVRAAAKQAKTGRNAVASRRLPIVNEQGGVRYVPSRHSPLTGRDGARRAHDGRQSVAIAR